jgi:hypothetical protein
MDESLIPARLDPVQAGRIQVWGAEAMNARRFA